MEYNCAACGCRCGYKKLKAAMDTTYQKSTLKSENLSVEESDHLQQFSQPQFASDVATFSALSSQQKEDSANDRTNECSELVGDVISGSTLDVIHNKLNMETLPEGFLYNRVLDKILLYKLDISLGIISIECGIILTSDYEVICSSYSEVLPVNNYEDLLSQEKRVTRLSQLLNLMTRLGSYTQARSVIKTDPDVSNSSQNLSDSSGTPEAKLEPVGTGSCLFAATESLTTQPSTSENYSSGNSEAERKYEVQMVTESESTSRNGTLAFEHCAEASNLLYGSHSPLEDQEHDVSLDSSSDAVVELINELWNSETEEALSCQESINQDESIQEQNNLVTDFKEEAFENCVEILGVNSEDSDSDMSDLDNSVTEMIVPKRTTSQGTIGSRQSTDKTGLRNRCPICRTSFNRFQDLKRHIHHDHPTVEEHKCQQCEKSFSGQLRLSRHIMREHGDENCGGDEWSSNCDQPHTSTAQLDVKPYKCSQCDSLFIVKAMLDQHVACVHNSEQPHSNELCDISSSQHDHLMLPQVTVDDGIKHCVSSASTSTEIKQRWKESNIFYRKRSYPCPDCSKVFSQKGHLNTHVKGVHKNLKPYECIECDCKFKRKDHLQRHVRAVHLKVKSFLCSVCVKSFSKKYDLLSHVNALHR